MKKSELLARIEALEAWVEVLKARPAHPAWSVTNPLPSMSPTVPPPSADSLVVRANPGQLFSV